MWLGKMREAVLHLKSADPILRQVIETVGPYAIRYRPPEFSTLVRSITAQQVSGKAAATVYARLSRAASRVTAASIQRLADEQLRSVGLSGQKATYIRDLSERTLRRELRFRSLARMSDEDVIVALTKVRGVGVWTAQMFLIFALRRPDVLPTGDLGIRSAMRNVYELPDLPSPEEMERIAQPWRPWASVGCWYLWRSLDGPAEL
jgi:DNA-3-methyladenine glycosylase II